MKSDRKSIHSPIEWPVFAPVLPGSIPADWRLALACCDPGVWLASVHPARSRTGLAAFLQSLTEGQLQQHALTTLVEVLAGLLIGGLAATSLGYLLAKSALLEKLLSPYLVASQSLPVVAIAPLLIIWFGPGIFSKILICSLTVFFPILINTVVGLREVPNDLRDLMRTLKASSTQTLWKLEVPAALPIYMGGLRVGATLSVIGAVVGELVGSDRGLGFLINIGRGQYDTALVFVAIFTLVFIAVALYGLVLLIERQFLSWQSWRQNAR